MSFNFIKKSVGIALSLALTCSILSSCKPDKKILTDPKNPVTITVWHYYNGALKNAFDSMIKEFNETIGMKEGIIVEGVSHGDIDELEDSVTGALTQEVGYEDLPNIFASYADLAYTADQKNVLIDLNKYFSEDELSKFIPSYVEEGKISNDGSLKILPIAKSTEVFMINKTDWEPFAEAENLTYDDLKTKEGLVEVAEKYYNWTDNLTPDIANDGKAFYGRDALANLFIVGSKQLGNEIFSVENGEVHLNLDKDIIRKIWDNYYVPYVKGYFYSNGRYRSDDAKVGDIIALIGSTASVAYFPTAVTVNDETHDIESDILTVPVFGDGETVNVQQGAGMVVTKSTNEEEFASVEFLKWFTDTQQNIQFSAASGYLPVVAEANDINVYMNECKELGIDLNDITHNTLVKAFEEVNTGEMYTYKAFANGSDARDILSHNLADKAVADRKAFIADLESGATFEDTCKNFFTDEKFERWFEKFKSQLEDVISQGN